MIPGSNLLNTAMRLIAPQSLQFYSYQSRSTNDVGVLKSNYLDPIELLGSFQPIPRTIYTYMGLDFSKQYFMFYASSDMQALNRGKAGDVLKFNNKFFEVISDTSWYPIDGWNGIMCVLLDNEPL